jgi:hypothetical protein
MSLGKSVDKEISMDTQEQHAKLVQVKLDMAARYERRARLTKSRPRKKTLLHHADSYRRQAQELQR